MAFAPPRPQSIFGRSAPPAPQIDWRLGAQVGQNIGGGIQSAMSSVAKGIAKFQEAKLKKANQEEVFTLARGMGLDEDDAKLASKQPDLWSAIEKINIEKSRVTAAQNLAKAEAARKAAEEQRRQGEYEADMFNRARELVPDLMMEDEQGNPKLDPFQVGQLHPDVQKQVFNLPSQTVMSAYKNKHGYRDMLKLAAKGKEGFKEISKNPDAHKAWKDLPDAEKNRLIAARPTQIIIGGTKQADDYAAETGNSPLPAGRGLILDALGNFKGHFNANTDSQSRYGQFVQALRDAKKDPDYNLNEQEVNAYFLSEQGMDAEKLNWLIMNHVSDPEQAAKLVRIFVETGGKGLGAGPAPGGGGTPAPVGGGGTPAPTTPAAVPLPKIPKP